MQNRGFELCLEIAKKHTQYKDCTYAEKDACIQAILIFIVIDLQWLQWGYGRIKTMLIFAQTKRRLRVYSKGVLGG